MKKFKVNDRVKLPFNETGTIKKIVTEHLDWFPYKVRIRKGTFNKTNQILEFKEEQLEHKIRSKFASRSIEFIFPH